MLAFYYCVYVGDAVSRSYAAASVFYGSHPALANVGLIWAPIPTLMQLPLILYRPFASPGFAGGVVSALAGAFAITTLDRILTPYLLERRFRFPVLFLYQTNVMILFYSMNGMSEMVFIAITLGCWDAFQRLFGQLSHANGIANVALMGIGAGLSFLTRYEGASFGAVMYLVLLIALFAQGRRLEVTLHLKRHRRLTTPEGLLVIEGYSLAYLAPFAYGVFLWLFFNWLIMGSPLYFMFGYGSGSQQAQTMHSINELFAVMKGSAGLSLSYAVRATGALFPAFFLAEILLFVRILRNRDAFALCLAIITASFPAFQALMNFAGLSFGSLRFYIYLIPFSVVAMVYALQPQKEATGVPLSLRRAVLILALALSSAVTLYGISLTYFLQAEEMVFVKAVVNNERGGNFAHEKAIAHYLADLPSNTRILADDLRADVIIPFTDQFERFVTTRNPEFMDVARDPVGKVDYILVPRLENAPSMLLSQHPKMYESGAPFLQLEREFLGQGYSLDWRLYRVVNPETRGDVNH